jgi:hypothetical protein
MRWLGPRRRDAPVLPTEPALGGFAKLGRRQTIVRIVLVLVALAVLGGQVTGLFPLVRKGTPVAPLGATTVASDLMRGGQPADADLIALRDQYRIRAVVNLAGTDVAERAVAQDLDMGYLELEIPPDAAPTAAQLGRIVAFLRTYVERRQVVYLHDLSGREWSVVTSAMLLLLRGDGLDQVLAAFPAADRSAITAAQLTALRDVAAAKAAHGAGSAVPSGNRYAAAGRLTW